MKIENSYPDADQIALEFENEKVCVLVSRDLDGEVRVSVTVAGDDEVKLTLGQSLPSTLDDPEVMEEVESLAIDKCDELEVDLNYHVFYEHGQWFATIDLPEGHYLEKDSVTFSVVDTSDGLDLEEL